jgi:hypothetical protein
MVRWPSTTRCKTSTLFNSDCDNVTITFFIGDIITDGFQGDNITARLHGNKKFLDRNRTVILYLDKAMVLYLFLAATVKNLFVIEPSHEVIRLNLWKEFAKS